MHAFLARTVPIKPMDLIHIRDSYVSVHVTEWHRRDATDATQCLSAKSKCLRDRSFSTYFNSLDAKVKERYVRKLDLIGVEVSDPYIMEAWEKRLPMSPIQTCTTILSILPVPSLVTALNRIKVLKLTST